MKGEIEHVRCQKCLAINSMRREFCARCGTPLMLVVNSTAHRFEDEATPEAHPDYLLERISALETRLARTTEIAERALSFALRRAANEKPVRNRKTPALKGKGNGEGSRGAKKNARSGARQATEAKPRRRPK